jgi:putative GTP pyrophosphokinase
MNSIDAKYISDNIETVKDFVTAEMTESQFLSSIEKDMTSLQQFFMYYKCAIMEVETKFKVLNEQFSLHGESNPIEFIESRIKSYGSLYKKMESKSIPKNLEAIENSIHDIAGVRVVCSFIQDIYHLADCFLAQDDIRLIEKKDYIRDPKPNGYRSLHLIVEVPIFLEHEKRPIKVEVQLRTIAMDFWASLEHKLRYKKDLSAAQLRFLSGEMKVCADQSAAWDRRMQNIRNIIGR